MSIFKYKGFNIRTRFSGYNDLEKIFSAGDEPISVRVTIDKDYPVLDKHFNVKNATIR